MSILVKMLVLMRMYFSWRWNTQIISELRVALIATALPSRPRVDVVLMHSIYKDTNS